jgi:hypothetical protein
MNETVEQAPLQKGRKTLLAVGIFIVCTALLFPRAYRFEVPRLFLFWADYPPFTLTDFLVTPAGAKVRFGNSLPVTVQFSGAIPRQVELVSGRHGETPQAAPMTLSNNGAYTGQLTDLTADTWYYISANTGRSARYTATIDRAPRLRRMAATYRPPAYTKRGVSAVELNAPPEIQGVAGTQVELEIEADLALASAELTLIPTDQPAQTLPLKIAPNANRRALVQFTLERSGQFTLALTGADQRQKTPDAAQGKITIQQDEAPSVSFLTPGRNLLATPDMTVPLTVEASDDVAVQRVEMRRVVNQGKEEAQTLPPPPPDTSEYRSTQTFDLKRLGAKPGDVIEYYATAYDNDPKGIHNADSQRYWVWVVSPEDYQKALAQQRGPQQMMAQYRALAEQMKRLAEAQERLAQAMERNAAQAKANPNDPNIQAQTDALKKAQAELRAEAQQLAQQMRQLNRQAAQYDVEQGLKRQMQKMEQALNQAQEGMRQAQNAPTPGEMPAHAQQAAQQMQRAAQNAGQKVEKTLDQLEKLAPLHTDFQRLQDLAQQQAELAQQAQQLRDSLKNSPPDEFAQSRLKSLAEQQARHRDELNQIERNLREHAEQAQSVAPEAAQKARQVADALNQMDVSQTMDYAQQALAQQQAANGAAQAEAARQALESLRGKCKGGQGQCQSAGNQLSLSQLGQGMGQTLNQMAQRMGARPGSGQGQSGGGAEGSAYNAPTPGSRPDGSPGTQQQTQQATAAGLMAQSRTTRSAKKKRAGLKGEKFNDLSDDNLERLVPERPKDPTKRTDKDASRYPAEYRRLVRDYFKSVAGSK